LTVSPFGCIVFFAKSWEDVMSSFHDDLSGFGSINAFSDHAVFAVGQNADGPQGGGPGSPIGYTPSPTLITGYAKNLAFDLIWDSSVAGAPKAFIGAVDAAAELLVSLLQPSIKTIVYVDVGWGEVGNGALNPGALSESLSNFYGIADGATIAGVLAAHGDTVSAGALAAAPFVFTGAEGRVLGLLPEDTSSAAIPDGAIGFNTLSGTGYSWQFSAGGTRATQFNLQAAALHELTEVMGRVSGEGNLLGLGLPFYTPLDLFDFTAPNTLSLTTVGYFSINNGVTQMGQFNSAGAGDAGDWASLNSVADSQTLPPWLQDPFDAVLRPGYNLALSLDDLLVMKVLGY
jgi:hypothetical protein